MMLKRFLSVACCIMLLLLPTVTSVSAQEAAGGEETRHYITYFEDGSYRITTITQSSVSSNSRTAEWSTSGSKTICHYDSSGNQLYSLTVHGTFSFNDATAKAMSSSYSYTVDSFGWGFSSGSASHSGATASATAIFKLLGVLSTQTLAVSLTCSPTGTLS